MSLVYSFVSRGTTVLAEYAAYAGDFAATGLECLQSVGEPGAMFTAITEGRSFNFLSRDGYIFLVVGDEGASAEMTAAFLERASNEFLSAYDTRARSAPQGSLTKRFAHVLKEHMEYVMAHPTEESRIQAVQRKAAEVRAKMAENIEAVMAGGEALEASEDRAAAPLRGGSRFEAGGRMLRRHARCQAVRVWCALLALAALVLAAVGVAVCVAGEHCVV
ncbi:unnamed protein product [Ostreobium quekettii]|uniref:Longin domain-containing protein n=1 Tax=Ostreobium quekettii TaxID=121088 RepID=A0A8S1IP65_9CHLO|nr:unnamed protein product [Ostreobium quekettii]|eukprot:evm.model.scf_3520.1 EVM.evm.TU.scf_3520.1   scf_3520:10110-10766(-)